MQALLHGGERRQLQAEPGGAGAGMAEQVGDLCALAARHVLDRKSVV